MVFISTRLLFIYFIYSNFFSSTASYFSSLFNIFFYFSMFSSISCNFAVIYLYLTLFCLRSSFELLSSTFALSNSALMTSNSSFFDFLLSSSYFTLFSWSDFFNSKFAYCFSIYYFWFSLSFILFFTSDN